MNVIKSFSQAQRVGVKRYNLPRGRSKFLSCTVSRIQLLAKGTLSWAGNDQPMKMRVTSRAQDKEPVVNNNLKTHTIIARTANMIQSGIKAENILMFTFTRKAAEEMCARVASKIGNASRGMIVSTYHSFCVRLLRKYIDRLGFRRKFSIYDEEDKLNLMDKVLADMKKRNGEFGGIKAREFAAVISDWKEQMLSPQEALQLVQSRGEDFKTLCAEFYAEYTDKMRKCNALDFDDLIYLAIRLLETNPTVLAKVNAQYKYITAGMSAATIAR